MNGVVRNIDEFYEAFGVSEGDALYLAPEERVRILGSSPDKGYMLYCVYKKGARLVGLFHGAGAF